VNERVRPDCRHYNGYKPCGYAEDCLGCPHFEPMGPRVLIIKLGALGDVLRTTPLLSGIAEQIPGAEVVWLTSPAAKPLLAGNPLIKEILATGSGALARLQVERFDRVICLDKEPEAAACATLAAAPLKQGFGLNDQGRLIVFNEAALESLRLGLSDELKFRQNEKSYQQLAFEAAELNYRPEYDYLFHIPEEDESWAEAFLAEQRDASAKLTIGFNLGGGDVFANKTWKIKHFAELRRLIGQKWGQEAAVLVLGGPGDQELMEEILASARDGSCPPLIETGANSISRFAALLKRCQILITGDSLGLHLALAVGTWCLLLIGSTTHREIELYGRGEMMVSDMDCSPCYRSVCPVKPDCMDRFTPEMVMARLEGLVKKGGLI